MMPVGFTFEMRQNTKYDANRRRRGPFRRRGSRREPAVAAADREKLFL